MTHKPDPLITFLETLEDVRRAASCRHNFTDILVIAVCAIIANADTWQDMEEFGKEKEDWLRTFLELPHGIPSQYPLTTHFTAPCACWTPTNFRSASPAG